MRVLELEGGRSWDGVWTKRCRGKPKCLVKLPCNRGGFSCGLTGHHEARAKRPRSRFGTVQYRVLTLSLRGPNECRRLPAYLTHGVRRWTYGFACVPHPLPDLCLLQRRHGERLLQPRASAFQDMPGKTFGTQWLQDLDMGYNSSLHKR